ncbi:MAG TPA: tetratricopeptide repeat protein, partial [Caldilineaceae bacterium]|nr:tetratricopeptide repeat protein [Caldilineaceae bacterium]
AVLLVNANADIEQLASEHKWAEAMQAVERAQQQLPNEPELLVWETVLAEQLGDTKRAEAALERARQSLPGQEVALWTMIGNQRLTIGNVEGAEAAAHEALRLAPDDPQANFLLGSVAEAKGDIPTAIDQFNRVFDLAEQSNPQLAVIARVRMGNLMQQVQPFPPTSTITPTLSLTPTAPSR